MRIQNRIEINAPVDRVYDALTDLDNIPKHFPGITAVQVKHIRHDLVGTRLDFTTEEGKHTMGEIKRVLPRRNILIEDARGITQEFVLHPTKQGTTEAEEIILAPDVDSERIKSSAAEKLQRFAQEIEQSR